MRQRILGSHTPPCHKRMVITTLLSVFLAALQRGPVLYHTRWLLTVLSRFQGGGGAHMLVPDKIRTTFRGLHSPWGTVGVRDKPMAEPT